MEKTTENKGVLKASKIEFNHTNFIFLLSVFLLLKVIFFLLLPSNQPLLASDLTTQNILTAINQQRQLRDLAPLNTNSILTEAAQYKSDDMQARHYFSHVDPNGHYIWDKIVALGYTPYLELGENLAIEFYDTDSLISAWMNSPEHRANILQPTFQAQGMGLTFGNVSAGQYYSAITNTFGTLAPVQKTAPKPAPTAPKASSPAAKTSTASKTKTQATLPSTPSTTLVVLVNPVLPSQTPASTLQQNLSKATGQIQALLGIISPREEQQGAQNNQTNFSLGVPQQNSSNSLLSAASATQNPTKPMGALVGSSLNNSVSSYEVNRYLILTFGIFLLVLILLDLRNTIKKNDGTLDKKINNLVMLLMSLIVIAFMYWL